MAKRVKVGREVVDSLIQIRIEKEGLATKEKELAEQIKQVRVVEENGKRLAYVLERAPTIKPDWEAIANKLAEMANIAKKKWDTLIETNQKAVGGGESVMIDNDYKKAFLANVV